MPDTADETADLYDADGPIQHSRAARLLLAELGGDLPLAASVWLEMRADPRGERVAHQAVILTLIGSLIGHWAPQTNEEELAEHLRLVLLEIESRREVR